MEYAGPEQSYCSLLDAELIKRYSEASDTYYPLRPSAAGYCARKLAYELAAFEKLPGWPKIVEDRQARNIRLLDLGHHIETHALSHLEKIPGFTIRYKQQVVDMFTLPSGRLIEGSTDAVMWSNEHRGLLDVKSVGNGWSASFRTRWDEYISKFDRCNSAKRFDDDAHAWWIEDPCAFIDEVGEDAVVANIIQINLYACSEFMRTRGIDHGIVYRYEKNGSAHMELRFKPSMKLFQQTKEKYAAIEAAVAAGNPELVKKGFVLGSMACAYCPYKARCWPAATKRDHFANLPDRKWAVRIGQLEKEVEMAELFEQWESLADKEKAKQVLERHILAELDSHGVSKVKLSNGNVYECKQLSKEMVLRRTKE